jgi:hypothetical protein
VQATSIDVSSECPCGHGRVTCISIYGGADLNFTRDDLKVVEDEIPECVLYIDTFLGGDNDLSTVLEIWEEIRPFLEGQDYPKVRYFFTLPFVIHARCNTLI